MVLKYSVDMVRLSVPVRYIDMMDFYKTISSSPYVQYYRLSRDKDYRHNFKVNEFVLENDLPVSFNCFSLNKDMAIRYSSLHDSYVRVGVNDSDSVVSNSFYFAYQHNMEKISISELAKYNLVVEFNPNKCDVNKGILHSLLQQFFVDESKVRLLSCDVCTDIDGVSINDIVVDQNLKHTLIDYRSRAGRTIYVGKRGSNGQVKIYDKAAERGLADKILTRWEVHLTFDDLYLNMILGYCVPIKVRLPSVFFNNPQEKFIDDVKLRCCVMAVKNGYANLRDFDYRYREKIRQCLSDTACLKIDDTNIKDLSNTIIAYFYSFCKELNILKK